MTIEQIAAEAQEKLNKAKEKLIEEKPKEELKDGLQKGEENKEGEVNKETKPAESKLKEVEKKPDAVIKREEEIQAKIDKLISEKKALEFEVGDLSGVLAQVKTLEDKLAALETDRTERTIEKERSKEPDPEEQADSFILKNANKYLEEDKEKPREKRRELTREELDEWVSEDITAAQEWLAKRTYRREREREGFLKETNDGRSFSEFRKRQEPFVQELTKAFPQLDVSNRVKELVDEGKSEEQVTEILSGENLQFKTMVEIINSDPKKYKFSVNGPALVAEEMKKRLKSVDSKEKVNADDKSKDKKVITDDDEERIRQEAAEEERQRQANIDAGIDTTSSGKVKEVKEALSEYKARILKMAAKKGISEKVYNAAVERRKKAGYDNVGENGG